MKAKPILLISIIALVAALLLSINTCRNRKQGTSVTVLTVVDTIIKNVPVEIPVIRYVTKYQTRTLAAPSVEAMFIKPSNRDAQWAWMDKDSSAQAEKPQTPAFQGVQVFEDSLHYDWGKGHVTILTQNGTVLGYEIQAEPNPIPDCPPYVDSETLAASVAQNIANQMKSNRRKVGYVGAGYHYQYQDFSSLISVHGGHRNIGAQFLLNPKSRTVQSAGVNLFLHF